MLGQTGFLLTSGAKSWASTGRFVSFESLLAMLDVTSHAVWTQSRYTTCIDKHFHVPSRGCCRWWMMWQHWPWYSELKYSPNSESHYTVLVSNTSLTSNINPIRANVTSFCTSPVLCSHWNQLWALFSVILCNGTGRKFDFFHWLCWLPATSDLWLMTQLPLLSKASAPPWRHWREKNLEDFPTSIVDVTIVAIVVTSGRSAEEVSEN